MCSQVRQDHWDEPDPALLRRIRAEFFEMPGLQLTLWQACRLWGIDAQTCVRAIARLRAEGFLRRTPDGLYACESYRTC